MSTTNDPTPEGVTRPTVADGLRAVADWLDKHPEVSPRYAFVPVNASEREHLESLADALGDRATEHEVYGPNIEIVGVFPGGVRVYGQVPLERLASEPVKPKYDPILKPAEVSEGDEFSVKVQPHEDES
jgi:hypothetical protein